MVDYVASPCLCWFTFGVHVFPAILVDSWGLRPEYRGTFAGRHVRFQEMSVAERVAERLVHGSGYGWFHWGVSHDVDTSNFWVAFLDPSLSERENTWSSKINLFHNCWLHGGILWVFHLLNRRKTQENIFGLLRCVLGLPGYFGFFNPFSARGAFNGGAGQKLVTFWSRVRGWWGAILHHHGMVESLFFGMINPAFSDVNPLINWWILQPLYFDDPRRPRSVLGWSVWRYQQ